LLFGICAIYIPYVNAESVEINMTNEKLSAASSSIPSSSTILPVVLAPQTDAVVVEPLPKVTEQIDQSHLPVDFQNRIKEANNGKVDAMIDVGVAYLDGAEFLEADEKKAYYWFKKA
ncbi:SEL1-like repeat protein, partial [Bacillus subtilis]